MLESKRLNLFHLIFLVCLAVLLSRTYTASAQKDGLLRVYFLDVGQGDSEFIVTPTGAQILIDGGPDDTVLSKLGEIMPFYDHDIDMVIVSHPHSDHISGLIKVLDRYNVKTVVEAFDAYNSPQYRAWEQAISDEGAEHIEAMNGQVFTDGASTEIRILHPLVSFAGQTLTKPHEANVTAMLVFKNTRVLLTGDMEKKAEETLIAHGDYLSADVLKVGHHGSNTSTGQHLLDAVTPKYAVIEAGKNNIYHLPTAVTLKRLADNGIQVFRTDEDGMVTLTTDGDTYQIAPAL